MTISITLANQELLDATDDDLACDFCSLEFASSSERNEHILQHFRQTTCGGCLETLICIGGIWYGPHRSSNCCTVSIEAQKTAELTMPDFIEVKQEEIIDVDGNEGDLDESDHDIFTEIESIENDNEIELNDSAEDETNEYDSMEEVVADEVQPYSLSSLRGKAIENPYAKEKIGGVESSTCLTKQQLTERKCPVCGKFIINKQNLICHMNIHNNVKPFVCTVCEKSFAHIRNLIRHKEQQGHCDMEYKCTYRGCKKRYMSSNKLNRHIKHDHIKQVVEFDIERPKPYACTKCDKKFTARGFLVKHELSHDKE